jgi:hypothetical protein
MEKELEQLYENRQGIFKLTTKIENRKALDQFLEALRQNEFITHLVLYQNEMGDEFSAEIAQAVLEKPGIEFLYFWSNQIGDIGAKAISESLRTSNLVYLDLSRNNIGDAGAKAISEAFTRKSQLNGLDLSFNLISDIGVIALATQMGNKLFLSKVNLSHNAFSDKGMDAWIKVQSTFRFLYALEVQGALCDPSKLVVVDSLNNRNKRYRETQALQLRRACRFLLASPLPLPPEITKVVLDYCATSFTYSEMNTLQKCFLNPCFLGWIHSPVPFSVDELLRRCACLRLYEPDFQKLWELKQEHRLTRQKLANLKSQSFLIQNGPYVRVVMGILLPIMCYIINRFL